MNEERAGQLTGGVFLVGIGLLFATGIGFWPNILLVIAAVSAVKAITERRRGFGDGAKGSLFMLGAWAFFTFGGWAMLLILMGLGMLMGGVFFNGGKDDGGEKFADRFDTHQPSRKRKMEDIDDHERIAYVVGDDGELVPEDEYVEKRKLR